MGHFGFGKSDSDETKHTEQIANTILNSYHSSSWHQDANALMQDYVVRIYVDSADSAKEELTNVTPSFEVDQKFHDYANVYAEERTAELVKGLEDSTKGMLKADLMKYMDQGLTPAEISQKLQDNYAFSERRATTIARTETAFAWNHAGLTTYQMGGAKYVFVSDGNSDPDCKDADGQTWTFSFAFNHMLSHPRCVRSFAPVMEDVEPDRGGELPSGKPDNDADTD